MMKIPTENFQSNMLITMQKKFMSISQSKFTDWLMFFENIRIKVYDEDCQSIFEKRTWLWVFFFLVFLSKPVLLRIIMQTHFLQFWCRTESWKFLF